MRSKKRKITQSDASAFITLVYPTKTSDTASRLRTHIVGFRMDAAFRKELSNVEVATSDNG